MTHTYLNSHLVYSAKRAKVIMRGKFVFENTGNVSFSDDYSFYSLGGEIDCSDQAIASLKENQAYFKAMNYYFYPYWIGEYVDCVSSYYSEPIISNGIPYFQIGTSRELVQGDAISHGVIQYNQKKYFYNFTNLGFTQKSWTKKGLMSTDPPDKTAYDNKYGNLAGSFVECQETIVNEYFNYVAVGTQKYVLVNGAFLPFESYSKVDISAIGEAIPTHTIKLNSDTHKFTPGMDGFKSAEYVEFSPLYEGWVFCANEK